MNDHVYTLQHFIQIHLIQISSKNLPAYLQILFYNASLYEHANNVLLFYNNNNIVVNNC